MGRQKTKPAVFPWPDGSPCQLLSDVQAPLVDGQALGPMGISPDKPWHQPMASTHGPRGRLLGVVGGTLRHALLDVQSNMTPPDAKKFHQGMVVFHRNI